MNAASTQPAGEPIVTVTLNPAIDQTLSIPGFAAGQVNRVAGGQSHAGGKGVNVAAVLADIGAPVIAAGFLGEANAGEFEMFFRAKRIQDEFVRLPGSTRVGIKITNDRTGETTDINFAGLSPSVEAVTSFERRIHSLVRTGRWFVLAGSICPGVDSRIYARLTETIRAGGGKVALDTSGAPLHDALAAGPDIAKPNIVELSELAGAELKSPADVVAAARRLLIKQGVKLAVVSMGGDGAIFIDAKHALIARPPKVVVKSTVGAGDAMVAGLVFSQYRGLPLEACAKLATALGATAVTRVGAGLDSPTAHEALFPNITVESIA